MSLPLPRGRLGGGKALKQKGIFMSKTDPDKTNKTHLHNSVIHKDLRKSLRKNSTNPEQKLWQKIRNKQLGIKFRRQQGVGRYIVDFYSAELNLVIEIDGDNHFTNDAREYDFERDEYMKGLGIRILRFTNYQINQSLNDVLVEISKSITPS
jgi:very-short-patch-repair endonuclease